MSFDGVDNFGSNTVFERIPEYNQVILDLSKGNLDVNFSLNNRKCKLEHTLKEILFDEKNDELSYFVLYMDSKNASNYVKFLLDLNNFMLTSKSSKTDDHKENIESVDNHKSNYQNFEQDAISIFEKYISKDAKYSIELDDELITDIIRNICPEKNEKIKSDCFDQAGKFAFKTLEQFYDKYLISEYHCKYLKNILETKCLTLPDILFDDFAVVFFLEFLEQENVSCLLKFWMQADNFTRNLQQMKNSENLKKSDSLYKQWQNDAMIIYDNYISLQAKSVLGFDDLVRRQVELNICQIGENEKEDLEYTINTYSNCFYIPLLIVFSILEKSYFIKFLNSSMYQKYVKEVLSNTNFETGVKQEPKIATSEKDESKKYEPLWSNPLSSNMHIGKIDKMGRFIRFLDNNSKNEKNSNKTIVNKNTFDNDDDIWNLYDNEDLESKKSSDSDIFGLKIKFDKLMNMIPVRSSPKFTEDDYELAEKIAANLVNEVIQLNQSN